MCGIAGIFGDLRDPDPALLERMTARLAHRGPDGRGTLRIGYAGLGSTRLSLVDLDGGAQPMSGAGGLTLVFNGEIYNHAAVRRDLEQAGRRFQGRSDTEVVLQAFEQQGSSCLEALEGMFAFAVSDGERLFLARDAFGIKPLFYALVDGGRRLVFASEIKALLEDPAVPRTLDRAALFEWATFRHILGEGTFFAAIRQVPQGGTLEVTRSPDGVLELRPGRHSRPRPVDLPARVDDLVSLLLDRLTASVRSQQVADHPVGAFLSGGVDSALMATLMVREHREPVHTFTLADDPDHADVQMSRRLAAELGSRHHEYIVTADELIGSLPRVICALEAPAEPTIAESAAPRIRRHVKAALCGDGADELFAGYAVHAMPQRWLRSCMDGYNRMIRTGQVQVSACSATKAALGAMASPDPAELRDAVYRFFLEGQLTYSHLLVWDRGAMASGLEVRVPYLDRSIRDLALSLPWEHRIQGDVSKALLRGVARRALPEALAAEIVARPKQAAPSAVRNTTEALDRAAREILPAEYAERHPLRLYCAGPAQQLLLDLFIYLFAGRSGEVPEGFRWRELYTTHRDELEAALVTAVPR